MKPEDMTPAGSDDPRWDELVENFRTLDQDAPREPSAQEREQQLRKLFNTGPGALPGPRDYQPQDDQEDGGEQFIPEEPPALGSGNPLVNLAWTAAVGGPVGLLLCVILFRSAPTFVYIGLAIAAVLGTAYLLLRLPTERDPGDDGARV
ncbi:hypothetical protein [Glutamicibacter uratoxydans]|nr:hypothetical protein [Glutamicibacter uratoxydans]